MKIVLIHCYSDNNKGDLGIMLATITLLRHAAPDATIEAISTFEEKDPFFQSEHDFLRQNVERLIPAAIGRAWTSFGNIGLLAKVILDCPKLAAMYLPSWFPLRNLLLGKNGRRAQQLLRNADLVVSKGGSFLCSDPGIKSNLRLFRLMSTLALAQSVNSNVVVWGQSIGPVSSSWARKVLNILLRRTRLVVLREDVCKKNYPGIRLNATNTEIGCDLAFNLELSAKPPNDAFVADRKYVGFTIKPYRDRNVDKDYTACIVDAIRSCVMRHRRHVIIVPHVTIDSDQEKSAEVYRQLSNEIAEHVTLLNDVYQIDELMGIYKGLDLLVGTRLHSTIFAMSAGTPAINVSYHGTKSQGVYARMGLEEFVVDTSEFRSDRLNSLISRVLSDTQLRETVSDRIEWVRGINRDYAERIVSESIL